MSIDEIWSGSWKDIERWVAALYVNPEPVRSDEEAGEDDEEEDVQDAWPTRVEIVAGSRFSLGQNPTTTVDISEAEQDDGVRLVREAAEQAIQDHAGEKTQITLTLKGYVNERGEERLIQGKRGTMSTTFTRRAPPAPVAPPAPRNAVPTPFSSRTAGEPPAVLPRAFSDGNDGGAPRRFGAPPPATSVEGMQEIPNMLSFLWAIYQQERAHREYVIGQNSALNAELIKVFRDQALNAQTIAADERSATRAAQAAEIKVEQERMRATATASTQEARADLAAKKAEIDYRLRLAEMKEQHAAALNALRTEFEEARKEEDDATGEVEETRKPKRRRKPAVDPLSSRLETLISAVGDKVVERIAGSGGAASAGASEGPLPGAPPVDAPVRPLGSRPPPRRESSGEVSQAEIMAQVNSAKPEDLAFLLLAMNADKRRATLQALAQLNQDAALDIADELSDAIGDDDAGADDGEEDDTETEEEEDDA